jgi:hypothetical protein
MCLELDVVGDASTQQCRNGNEYSGDHIWLDVGRGSGCICVLKDHIPWPDSPLHVGAEIGPREPLSQKLSVSSSDRQQRRLYMDPR